MFSTILIKVESYHKHLNQEGLGMVLILPPNSRFVSLLHLEIVLKDRSIIAASLGRNK